MTSTAGYALDADSISYAVKGIGNVERHIREAGMRSELIIIPPFPYYEVKRNMIYKNAVQQLCVLDTLLESCPLGLLDAE